MAKATITNAGSSKFRHPLYNTFAPSWLQALDVYEGIGGFLDETRPYLLPHPREWLDHSIPLRNDLNEIIGWQPNPNPIKPSPKLVVRRKLSRYENIAATLMDTVMGALFLDPPARTFADDTANAQLAAWWANVDGKGADMTSFMRDAWVVAGVFGHAILVADKDATPEADGAVRTQADVTGPRLCRYTPLDCIDWLVDDEQNLIGVKLLESVPRTTFEERPLKATDYRVRVIGPETWTLYDHRGQPIEQGAHGFGVLPVTVLYGRRRPLTPVVGKSVMGDPQLYIDAYNLISEVRELLRNQTFALLNVPVGVDGDVQREQEKIGRQSGTGSVLFSTNPASYISPQPDNVSAYHEHLDRLNRTIYRLASVPWEGDSRDAESADSRRLKRQDLHNVLSQYAGELQRTETVLLDFAYRAIYGPDRGPAQQETDGATVTYPTAFEPPDLEAVAARCGELIGLDLGETAVKEMKKRTVRSALPNLSQAEQAQSDTEIDAMTVQTAEEKQAALLEQTQTRLASMATRPQPMPPAA